MIRFINIKKPCVYMANKSNFRIEEILDKIFDVNLRTRSELAKTFVRFQEYFENPHFRGQIFTLDEFKAWYTANSEEGKKTGKFTYYQDWDGFNIPSNVFDPFYGGRFNPLSQHEVRLLDAFEPRKGTDFYVLGTFGKATAATKVHEISHGLFYTNPDYRQQVLEVVHGMSPEDREKINTFLEKYGGCHPDFWEDETQAYLLDRRCLGANKVSSPGLAKAGEKIKQIYRKIYNPVSR